jgi:hypothetical protein
LHIGIGRHRLDIAERHNPLSFLSMGGDIERFARHMSCGFRLGSITLHVNSDSRVGVALVAWNQYLGVIRIVDVRMAAQRLGVVNTSIIGHNFFYPPGSLLLVCLV